MALMEKRFKRLFAAVSGLATSRYVAEGLLFIVAILGLAFLMWPHFVAALGCLFPQEGLWPIASISCLDSVAKGLREDSNVGGLIVAISAVLVGIYLGVRNHAGRDSTTGDDAAG